MMNCTTLTLLALLAAAGDPQPRQASSPDFGVEELRAHYAAAEAELRQAPLDGLSQAQREQRGAMLDALAAYRVRGDFGIAEDGDFLRPLRFVDDAGRRCAVAELLHVSGRDDLVEQVAAIYNEAFVVELAEIDGLGSWLNEVGLTLDEAARIQGPARGTNWGRGGPGDTVGGRGRPGTGSPAAGRPGTAPRGRPSGGEMPSGPSTLSGPGAQSGPVTPEMQQLLGADWWSWWEFAKVGFLGEGRLVSEIQTDDGRTRSVTLRDNVVRRVLPILRERLDDKNSTVRAAAAVSFGRLAGEAAVPELQAMLDDASLEVREAALLGLGATGSEKAAHLILSIAHELEVEDLDAWRETEEIAVLALGLLRERGAATGVDSMLPDGDGLMSEATFLHAALAPSESIALMAREESALFQGRRKPRYDRQGDFADVLAIEALREFPGDDVLTALLTASAERDIERRRAAVATLGSLRDARADGPLRTAFETESDAVARGLALIAIANTGATGADEFLARTLSKGRSVDRPWAALALGVLAREHGVTSVGPVLRTALKSERNRDNRRAIALSLGIARDTAAVPDLIERIQETGDPGSRVAYGYALGLIGDPSAAPVLRAALEVERFSLPRSELAQALAVLRQEQDIPDLVESLRKANDPDAAVQSAGALSFHGSLASVPLLIEVLDEVKSAEAEASALLAIGLVLDSGSPFAIAGELRDRNPFVAPDWFLRATQTTL